MCVVGAGTDGSGQSGAGGGGQQVSGTAGDGAQPVLGWSPSTGATCGKALLGAATLHYLALRLYVTPGIGSLPALARLRGGCENRRRGGRICRRAASCNANRFAPTKLGLAQKYECMQETATQNRMIRVNVLGRTVIREGNESEGLRGLSQSAQIQPEATRPRVKTQPPARPNQHSVVSVNKCPTNVL